MSSTRRLLMCEPRYFRVAYEINPWMRVTNAVDGPAARQQWRDLHRALVDLGVEVSLIEQKPHVPDLVFTANAGIVIGSQFVPSNFRHAERQPEAPIFTRWFSDRGFEVTSIPPDDPWEGEGDVLECDGRVFAASGIRTRAEALDGLEAVLRAPVVRLELVDPRFYHLDTCLFPLSGQCAAYYPPAFSEQSRQRLAEAFDDLVEVPDEEALRFACNSLLVGETVVMNTGAPRTVTALERRGFRCVTTPTDEFIKAGGSVKCLVLTLDTFGGS